MKRTIRHIGGAAVWSLAGCLRADTTLVTFVATGNVTPARARKHSRWSARLLWGPSQQIADLHKRNVIEPLKSLTGEEILAGATLARYSSPAAK